MTIHEQHQLDLPTTDSSAPDAPLAETYIRPIQGWTPLNLGELWEYRELLYFLTWRDIKVRYKQTALGAAWAVLQPFLTMVVFSVIFGRLAGIPSDGVPYPIFAYAALVPWTFFANGLTQASNSLVAHERMITKIYFPKLLIPIAAVLSSLVDFAIAFTILVGMALWYGIVPGPAILALPLFVLLAMLVALGVSFWFSALNVQYRDVRYVVPFVIQFWLFATPIVYPSSLIPEPWRTLSGLNPMAGVVEGFRWMLLGQGGSPSPLLAVSILTVIVVLVSGLFYFRRMEETFADVV